MRLKILKWGYRILRGLWEYIFKYFSFVCDVRGFRWERRLGKEDRESFCGFKKFR